jgi:hypothetical protein
VWVALVAERGDVVRERLKKRVQRERKRTSGNVEYMVVERRGCVVAFATHNLIGSDPPVSFEDRDVNDALAVLAQHGLKIPGPTRVPSYSRGWSASSCPLCGKKEKMNDLLRTFGSGAAFDDAWDAFADEVQRRTGIRPEPQQEPPRRIPLALWTQLSEEHLGEHREDAEPEGDGGHRFP